MEFFYLIFIFMTVFYKVDSLKCRSCHGIIDPKYCVQTTECAAGELCYTEQVIDDDTNIFYNVGCKPSQLCNVAMNEGFGKRGQLHVCEKCCKYDVCNTNTCTHPNASVIDQCLSCSDVASPADCQTMVKCKPDEMCFTQEFVNDKLEKRFRLGCETKKRCDLLFHLVPHQRSTQLCNQCCENTGCNKYLCGGGNVGSMTNVPTSSSTGRPLTFSVRTQPPSTSASQAASTRMAQTPSTTMTQTPSTTINQTASTRMTPAASTRQKTQTVSTMMPHTAPITANISMSTATTVKPCADSPLVTCSELDIGGKLCSSNNDAAVTYCPKYCKLC